MSPLRRLIAIASSRWAAMLLAALLGFLTVGSGVGLMMTAAWLIASAARQPSIAELQVAIVGVRFFGIVRGVLRYGERLVSHDLTFRLLERFRVWFYQAVEPLAPAALTRFRSGDLLSRLVDDVERLEHVYVRVLAPPLITLGTGLGVALLFGLWAPPLVPVFAGWFVAGAVLVPAGIRLLSRTAGRSLAGLRGHLNDLLLDGVEGMEDLLVYGRTAAHLAALGEAQDRYQRAQRRMDALGACQDGTVFAVMTAAVLHLLWTAIPLVGAGTLDGVMLAVIALGTMAAFEPVFAMPEAARHLDGSLAAAERLFAITDAPPAVAEPISPAAPPADHGLRIRDLTFAYPGDRDPVLRNVSLDLPAGGRVAIIGASGAGKSTLAALLVRFQDYRTGSIRMGDTELRNLPGEAVRTHIAVVPQRVFLFRGTLRDNLRIGDPEAGADRLWAALEAAGLAGTVRALPDGLDTPVGEDGSWLSGGERQRLAIARALLKDAQILIVDEPTAHLDAARERSVMDTIWDAGAGRTTVVITHRLAGLAAAETIAVMERGRIVERGAHADLLGAGGLYARMWASETDRLHGDGSAPRERR